MCSQRLWFLNHKIITEPKDIYVENIDKVYAYGSGNISIEMGINGQWLQGEMKNIYYMPKLGRCLFSVRCATNNGIECAIKGDLVQLLGSNQLVGAATWSNGLYLMNMRVLQFKSSEFVRVA